MGKIAQVSAKHIQSTHVNGENVQIFKDLNVSMDKYVLHSFFYVLDIDDVGIVLGYPWMDSIGIVNINVQKKFLKIWYKKKKIIVQDISLVPKQEETIMAREEVSIGELVVIISTITSNEGSKVESKEEPIKAHEEMP